MSVALQNAGPLYRPRSLSQKKAKIAEHTELKTRLDSSDLNEEPNRCLLTTDDFQNAVRTMNGRVMNATDTEELDTVVIRSNVRLSDIYDCFEKHGSDMSLRSKFSPSPDYNPDDDSLPNANPDSILGDLILTRIPGEIHDLTAGNLMSQNHGQSQRPRTKGYGSSSIIKDQDWAYQQGSRWILDTSCSSSWGRYTSYRRSPRHMPVPEFSY